MTPRYFHGGIPGLKPRERLTPQSVPSWKRDDCPVCVSGSDDAHHSDSIYVSTDKEYARFYASRFGLGDLYVVEPQGELVRSDEDSIETFKCSEAHVVSVYERAVRLTRAQRRRLFYRLPAKGLPLGMSYEQFEVVTVQAFRRTRAQMMGPKA